MSEIGKNSVTQALISENEHGQRLDNLLLKHCKGVPKSHIYRLVRSGQVRVNGGRVEVSYRLQLGDQVRIPPLRIAAQEVRADSGPARPPTLPLLYEDDSLLVVDKPAGIAVHGGSGESFGVIEALRKQRPPGRFLELAHRLDRETSGVLLLGKKRSALLALHDTFRQRAADKRYLTLVSGRWLAPQQSVKLPLHKYLLPSGERRVRVADDGKPARTVFRLLARWQSFSLLEAELCSGRTHQIRVHLAHLGFPIVGDDKYGDFDLNKQLARQGLKRMFLHAWKIRLPHPLDNREISFTAPPPPALNAFLQRLSAQERQNYGETW